MKKKEEKLRLLNGRKNSKDEKELAINEATNNKKNHVSWPKNSLNEGKNRRKLGFKLKN